MARQYDLRSLQDFTKQAHLQKLLLSCHEPACRYLQSFGPGPSLGVFSAVPSPVVPGSSSLNPPSVGSLLSASDNVPASSTLLNMSQLMNASFLMTQSLLQQPPDNHGCSRDAQFCAILHNCTTAIRLHRENRLFENPS